MTSSPVALITGSARRIGAAIAKHLHQAGYCVAIHAHHSKEEAHVLCASLNQLRTGSAEVFFADLLDPKAPETLILDTLNWAERLDLLVNNASCFIRTDDSHFDAKIWETLFTLNVNVPYALSLAARPHLRKQKGSIINLTDIHAHHPLTDYSVYCQSKAALTMQTLALAKAFAPEVRVNAVAPGAIAWPEGENTLSLETKAKIIKQTPLKQHGSPLHIAEAVLMLAQHTFITGQILKVDGGRSLVF